LLQIVQSHRRVANFGQTSNALQQDISPKHLAIFHPFALMILMASCKDCVLVKVLADIPMGL
jgi:hypothetical protein